MDEHTRRVTSGLRHGWDEYLEGRASVLDLSRLAGQAANALDNANSPLLRLLAAAESELEYAAYALEQEEQPQRVRAQLEPILALLAEP